jgi:hypothetical protein
MTKSDTTSPLLPDDIAAQLREQIDVWVNEGGAGGDGDS